MNKIFRQRLAMIAMLSSGVCLANSVACAQTLSKSNDAVPMNRAASTRIVLDGPDEPDFPPRNARVHHGTLYIEGTQGDDGIRFTDGLITFFVPSTGVELETIHVTQVAGFEDAVDVVVYGLAGDDLIQVGGWDVPATIFGGRGNDTIHASSGPSTVYGQDGDDTIYGSTEDDMLAGQGGNDTIFGQLGSDLIDGGAGADTLLGSFWDLKNGKAVPATDGEVDYLGGGSGPDTFVLSNADKTSDIVLDFNESEDLIE